MDLDFGIGGTGDVAGEPGQLAAAVFFVMVLAGYFIAGQSGAVAFTLLAILVVGYMVLAPQARGLM